MGSEMCIRDSPKAAPAVGMGAQAGGAGWAVGSAGTGSWPLCSAGCQQPQRRELCSLAIQPSSGPHALRAPALPGQLQAGAGGAIQWGLGWDGGGRGSRLACLWPGGESQSRGSLCCPSARGAHAGRHSAFQQLAQAGLGKGRTYLGCSFSSWQVSSRQVTTSKPPFLLPQRGPGAAASPCQLPMVAPAAMVTVCSRSLT